MSSIKGLIIKDLTVTKKLNIICCILLVIILSVAFLFRFAYIYGNLAKPEMYENEEDMINAINYLDMFMPLILSMVSAGVLFYYITASMDSDFKCRWNSVLFSSGVTEYQAVGAKYIEIIVFVICNMALNLLVNTVYLVNFRSEYSSSVYLVGIVAVPLMVGAFGFISVALMYMFKKSETVSTVEMIIIICIAVILSRKFIGTMETASVDPTGSIQNMCSWLGGHISMLLVISAAAFAVVGAAAYFVSVSFLKRREKICGD